MSRTTCAPRGVRAFLALASITLAAGATAQPAHHRSPDVPGAIERATAGLDVSAAQRADLDRIAARYADSHEPGIMWRVADEVRAVLTPAQIGRLQERPRTDRRRRDGEARSGHRGERRAGEEMRRERRPAGEAREGQRRMHRMDRGVAEQHAEAARALAERHREQMQALRQQRESGGLDREAFAEQSRALRERMRADIDPLLTEDARRMRAEMMERQERTMAVRDQVLRLNDEQREAMRGHQRRDRSDTEGTVLSTEQRATLTVYRALMRGAHGRGDGRMRTTDR